MVRTYIRTYTLMNTCMGIRTYVHTHAFPESHGMTFLIIALYIFHSCIRQCCLSVEAHHPTTTFECCLHILLPPSPSPCLPFLFLPLPSPSPPLPPLPSLPLHVGFVIYTDHEAKLLMNTHSTPLKRSTMDKTVDRLVCCNCGTAQHLCSLSYLPSLPPLPSSVCGVCVVCVWYVCVCVCVTGACSLWSSYCPRCWECCGRHSVDL